LAAVQLKGKWGFIDEAGNLVIPFKYSEVGRFSESFARVCIYRYIDAGGYKPFCEWNFIDKTGQIEISRKYDDAGDFSEGLARVKYNGKWGFINNKGTAVISFIYDEVSDFSEGMARVRIKRDWGFIDKTGKEVFKNIATETKIVNETVVNQTVKTQEQKKTEQPRNETSGSPTVSRTDRMFRFGLRTGINFSNMSGFDGLSKMLFGFQSGIVTDFSLPKNFSLQAGLLYAQQGFRMTGRYMGQKSTARWTLHYIQIPINTQYKLALGSKTSLLFQAGPYFGFCFLGTMSDNSITLPIRMGYKERDELRTFDFGLGLGVGVQVYGLQVGVGYNIGLYNLRPSCFSEKLRNHGLAITVTYLFGK